MDQWKFIAFHGVIFAVYIFALVYDTFFLANTPTKTNYAGRFKYLTFWNELIQTVYFGIALINNFFGSNLDSNQQQQTPEKYTRLQRAKDFFAATIVFPIGMFVVITFWSIYAYDRELMFPAALDKIIPSWINHVWHTYVIVFIVAEKLIIYQKYPSAREGLRTLLTFALIYMLWLFWIAYFGNIWVYPVLDVLGWPQRVLFFLTSAFLMCICYFIGEVITSFIWLRSAVVKKTE